MKTFIAMNRFKIAIGKEKDFENIWRNRETHLDDVDGFKKFNLLKGLTNEEYTLYTSHSTWDSKTDFENWTKSEAFRKAHSGGGQHKGIYLGHPQFEGFEVIFVKLFHLSLWLKYFLHKENIQLCSSKNKLLKLLSEMFI